MVAGEENYLDVTLCHVFVADKTFLHSIIN